MHRMSVCFAVVYLFAAVNAAHATCASQPLVAGQNVTIAYTGTTPACTAVGGKCAASEPIAFNAAFVGYAVECAPHTFTWSFDDGGTASGRNVTHAFASPGTHTATLTVKKPAQSVAVSTPVNVTVALPAPALTPSALVLLALVCAGIGAARLFAH